MITNINLTVLLQDAARAKALRAKFEEWEAAVGEDGGYINLVDENGCALETASKLKNRYCCTAAPRLTWPHHSRMFCRFEKLAVEPEAPQVRPNPRKFQVKRFKVDKTLILKIYLIFIMLFN